MEKDDKFFENLPDEDIGVDEGDKIYLDILAQIDEEKEAEDVSSLEDETLASDLDATTSLDDTLNKEEKTKKSKLFGKKDKEAKASKTKKEPKIKEPKVKKEKATKEKNVKEKPIKDKTKKSFFKKSKNEADNNTKPAKTKAEKVKKIKQKNKKVVDKIDKHVKKNTKFIFSINNKIASTVLVSVLLALVVTFFVTMSGFEKGIDSLVKTNMITAVKTYNTLLEDTILLTKNNLTTSNLTSLYREAGLDGIESSHIALVDEAGNYTYSPSYEEIGKPCDNQTIQDLVAEHGKKGSKLEAEVLDIDFNGTSSYVGYYPCDNGWLLLCVADKEELYTTYNDVKNTTLIDSAIILVVFAIFGFLVSMTITKPIKRLTGVIHKTANLDFKPSDELEKLCKGKDETGEMARALKDMQFSIKDVIAKINTAATNISENADNLNELSNLVNEHSTDNSATTEELAAGMQETASSSSRIDENISNILTTIDSISSKTKAGQKMAVEIMDKASKLKNKTVSASDNGKMMFENVRKETSVAIEKSKDVDKINTLTKTILDISDQTSLLSLNASIEAARAGEAGRGFAVVAEQIGHLANMSAQTVENIGDIVKDVNNAVNNMATCLETTLNFLEEKVLKDYDEFIGVSDEYNSDAVVFEKSMVEIYNAIDELDHSTDLIANAISGISSTINEASTGVSDIAEKTSNIVELTIETNKMVDESVEYAKDLNNIVDVFKL